MIRILDIPSEGPVASLDDRGRVAPPPPGTVRWIDLDAPVSGDLQLLKERFGFHPLTIDDCATLDQRPKIEPYEDHVFLVTQGFVCPRKNPAHVKLLELHAFLGTGYLITVHQGELLAVEHARARLFAEPAVGRRGADFIYYLVADRLVDENFAILDLLSDALEGIEERILKRPAPAHLHAIFQLKRSLVHMRRVLSPQRDVFALLTKSGDPRISDRTTVYLRDTYDHLTRIYESIDTLRDLLANDVDAYLSVASNRTNEIMKRLTILSAIFLPLSFVTGFFGQNFTHLPFESTLLMGAMIAACLFIPTGMLYWFFRSRWL